MGRRAKGTGTVYKSAGLWYGQIDTGIGSDGKRHRPKVQGRTQREVQQKLAQLVLDAARGRAPSATKETVKVFLARWLETVLAPSAAPSTITSRAMIVNRHLTPVLGRHPLARLTPAQVQQYVATKATTLAPRTVRLHHATLHAALEVAVDWDLIAKNPARRIKLPPVPEADYPVLDQEHALRLLRAVAEERLAALYVLGLTTGLRIGECLGLRWSAVDLTAKAPILRVERKLLRLKGRVLEDAPKGRRSRIVELVPLAVAALRRHQARQAEERLRLGAEWARPDLVFTSATGTPLWDSPITSYALPRLLERAGLPRMTFHGLRRSFASILLSDGADLSAVSALLGHANVTVTLNVYRKLFKGERRTAMDHLARLLPDTEPDG